MDNEEFIRQSFLTYEQKMQENREKGLKELGKEYSQVEINQLITQTKRDTGFGDGDTIDYILGADDSERARTLEAYKEYKKFLKVNESLFKEDDEEKPLARVKDKRTKKIELKDEDRITHHINEHSLVEPDSDSKSKETIQEDIVNLNNDDEVQNAVEKQNKESETSILKITDLIGDIDSGDSKEYDNESQVEENKAILQCSLCGHKYCIDPTKLSVSEDDDTLYNIDISCPFCHQSAGYFLLRGQIETKPEETPNEETPDEKNTDEESSNEEDRDDRENRRDREDTFSIDEIEDIDEESFNKEINKYLSSVYENISSFSCVRVNADEKHKNKLIIEGLLCFKDNTKPTLTKFYLIGKKTNKKIAFNMSNKNFCEGINPFRIYGEVKNENLIFENLHYNYIVDNNGEKVQIKG